MDGDLKKKSDDLGQLKDLVSRLDHHTQPFLYYLPQLLAGPDFSGIDPSHAVTFATLALKPDPAPIVKEALQILNKIINPEDGSLVVHGKDLFYDNRHFFWKELGGHTQPSDIVAHIFNRTFFYISVGNN